MSGPSHRYGGQHHRFEYSTKKNLLINCYSTENSVDTGRITVFAIWFLPFGGLFQYAKENLGNYNGFLLLQSNIFVAFDNAFQNSFLHFHNIINVTEPLIKTVSLFLQF